MEKRIEETTESSLTQHDQPTPLDATTTEKEETQGRPTSNDGVDVERMMEKTNQLKQTANDHFKSKRWQSALSLYSEALDILPPHPTLQQEEKPSHQVASSDTHPESPSSDLRISQLRSIIHANTAACFSKLEDWQSVIQACDNSLKDDPNYVKALHRRAQANEKIGTWASLQASLDDYNKMLNLIEAQDSSLVLKDQSLLLEIRTAKMRLPDLIQRKSEQDKAEMMDKLKHLGNSVLGKFGLSTDNFKFTPSESGGYSMSFQQ